MTQKELILLSLLLADTPEDRHGVYARRKTPPAPVPVKAPVTAARWFVLPEVHERPRPGASW